MNNPVKFSLGDIVKSVSGRDKDKAFVVMSFENNLARICDGKLRKIDKIKKKNPKRIKLLGEVTKEFKDLLECGGEITNAQVKQEIKIFESK